MILVDAQVGRVVPPRGMADQDAIAGGVEGSEEELEELVRVVGLETETIP